MRASGCLSEAGACPRGGPCAGCRHAGGLRDVIHHGVLCAGSRRGHRGGGHRFSRDPRPTRRAHCAISGRSHRDHSSRRDLPGGDRNTRRSMPANSSRETAETRSLPRCTRIPRKRRRRLNVEGANRETAANRQGFCPEQDRDDRDCCVLSWGIAASVCLAAFAFATVIGVRVSGPA